MPSFDECTSCGELLIEDYGAIRDDKCGRCVGAMRGNHGLLHGDVVGANMAVVENILPTRTNSAGDGSLRPVQHRTANIERIQDHGRQRGDRRYVRAAVSICGSLADGEGSREIGIVNLSNAGAKIQVERGSKDESALELSIPGIGTFHVKRIWMDGDNAGLEFADPPEEVERLITQYLSNELAC